VLDYGMNPRSHRWRRSKSFHDDLDDSVVRAADDHRGRAGVRVQIGETIEMA
jgi:hypothetical protein